MRSNPGRLLASLVIAALALLALPGAAAAHTDVEFTEPADGDTITQPVTEVVIGFTEVVEPVGDGFEVLDPQGNLLRPPAPTTDGQVYRLQLDPPLAGGAVGVRFEIRSEDGHVISDSFSFVVDAPPPTSAPSSTAPAATAPATTVSPVTTEPPASTTTVAATTTASPTTAGTSTTAAVAEPVEDEGSNNGLLLAILAAAAIGVGGFFLIRSRTSGAS